MQRKRQTVTAEGAQTATDRLADDFARLDAVALDAFGRLLPGNLDRAFEDLDAVAGGKKRGFKISDPATGDHLSTTFVDANAPEPQISQKLGFAEIIAVRNSELPKGTKLRHSTIEPQDAQALLDRL